MFYKIEYDTDQSVISSSVEDSDSDLSFYEIFFSSDFNVYEIVFSIFFGIANVLFVTVQLYGESRALDIDLMKYLFMSLNGRIGFVPFVSRLKNEKFRQERMIDQPLDIENIEGKIGPGSKDGPYNKKGWYKTTEGWLGWFRSLLTFTFIFEFEFDDESVKTFT